MMIIPPFFWCTKPFGPNITEATWTDVNKENMQILLLGLWSIESKCHSTFFTFPSYYQTI